MISEIAIAKLFNRGAYFTGRDFSVSSPPASAKLAGQLQCRHTWQWRAGCEARLRITEAGRARAGRWRAGVGTEKKRESKRSGKSCQATFTGFRFTNYRVETGVTDFQAA
ncbi:MAG: hypothetical protein KAU38_05805 [Desulfobacterales bacterium]|nr:hypothetical protein [Desulfobacterales bacterium]